MGDGTNRNQNLDLDQDGKADINYAASITDLGKIFTSLKSKLTESDHLFIYVIDHGGKEPHTGESYICLWGNEQLYPLHLNAWLTQLTVGSINCVFGQCFSGGFIEPLKAPNRIIATACKENEYSWSTPDKTFDSFVHAWTTGLMNVSKYCGENVMEADSDGDSFINMVEAFYFAYDNDIYGQLGISNLENPQFYYENDGLAFDLCFNRHPEAVDLYIRDNNDDIGIEPNVYPFTNNSPDIWVRNKKDNGTTHQNPILTTAGSIENYIYVKISNKGIKDYNPSDKSMYLHLNWATGACAQKFSTFTGIYRDQNSKQYGSAIKSILIDKIIPAGESEIFCVEWKTKGLEMELEENAPLSILATISHRPWGFAGDIPAEVWPKITEEKQGVIASEYKRIAIKNLFTPSQFGKNTWETPIRIQSLSNGKKYYSLTLQSGNEISIFDKLDFKLFSREGFPQIYTPTSSSDKEESNTRPIQRIVFNPDTVFTFTQQFNEIKYFGVNENQIEKLKLSAKIKDSSYVGNLSCIITLKEYPDDKIVGSYTFLSSLNKGTFNGRTLRIMANSLNDGQINLMADDSMPELDETLYEWTNECGEILGRGKELNLTSNLTQFITLNVYNKDNNETLTASLDSSSLIKLNNIYRNNNELIIETNMPINQDMVIKATSLVNPYVFEKVKLDAGKNKTSINISKFNNEFIVISLENNKKIIDSITIK